MSLIKKLVIFYGGSGSGKTTLEERFLEYHGSKRAKRLVSITTRAKRSIADNGYIFCKDREEFLEHNPGAIIQIGNNADWLYGVCKKSFKLDCKIGIISVISAAYAEEIIDFAIYLGIKPQNITLVYVECSQDERYKRIKARGENEEAIKARFDFEDKYQDVVSSESVNVGRDGIDNMVEVNYFNAKYIVFPERVKAIVINSEKTDTREGEIDFDEFVS